MNRVIFASKETEYVASKAPNNIIRVYSFFPIDRADCECKELVKEWKKRLGMEVESIRKQLIETTRFLECPRSKANLKRYKVTCGKCKQTQGYCWASDPSLKDWCDFHYVQWTKGDYWRGCFTPHVSPITQQLCLECCCSNDTRDFRANMTLSQSIAEKKEKENSAGREFNKMDSKFTVSIVKSVIT